jgi:hypothetical protein
MSFFCLSLLGKVCALLEKYARDAIQNITSPNSKNADNNNNNNNKICCCCYHHSWIPLSIHREIDRRFVDSDTYGTRSVGGKRRSRKCRRLNTHNKQNGHTVSGERRVDSELQETGYDRQAHAHESRSTYHPRW